MGRRLGLARLERVMENLKRDLTLGGTTLSGYLRDVKSVGSATTLATADSGKLIFLESSGGAFTLTLPSVAEGYHFRAMVTEDTPTGAITIAAGSAIMFGNISESEVDDGEDAPGSSAATGISNIIIGTGTKKGMWVELYSDGTSWYFFGNVANDGAITTS